MEYPRRSSSSQARSSPCNPNAILACVMRVLKAIDVPSSNRCKAVVDDLHRRVRFRLAENQRRRQPQRISARAQNQQAAFEAFVNETIALLDGAFFRLSIPHELHANHQPTTAH